MFLILVLIFSIMGGSVILGGIIALTALLMSGKIAFPNSPQRRVQQAKIERDVAVFQEQAAEARLQADRWQAERDLMNARTQEELQHLVDERFRRQLAAGEQGTQNY